MQNDFTWSSRIFFYCSLSCNIITVVLQIFFFHKVQLLWEGHKNLELLLIYLVNIKSSGGFLRPFQKSCTLAQHLAMWQKFNSINTGFIYRLMSLACCQPIGLWRNLNVEYWFAEICQDKFSWLRNFFLTFPSDF